jgi:hypothetical protein
MRALDAMASGYQIGQGVGKVRSGDTLSGETDISTGILNATSNVAAQWGITKGSVGAKAGTVAGGSTVATGVANTVDRAFKLGEDVTHFEKHGSEIAQTLGHENYSLGQYIQDANAVIRNGIYIPELNAYVSIPGGIGSAKGLMVGIDRATGEITTMPMKPIPWFETKAPSLAGKHSLQFLGLTP